MKSAVTVFALIVVIAIASTLAYEQLTSKYSAPSSTSQSFIDQPVGDVIILTISKNVGGGVINLPINMTRGESLKLTVSLYIQANLNVSSNFQILTWPSGSSGNSSITANFVPEDLSVISNVNASTVVTIRVLDSASSGQYNAVLSFADSENPSYAWGTNIQINILQ